MTLDELTAQGEPAPTAPVGMSLDDLVAQPRRGMSLDELTSGPKPKTSMSLEELTAGNRDKFPDEESWTAWWAKLGVEIPASMPAGAGALAAGTAIGGPVGFLAGVGTLVGGNMLAGAAGRETSAAVDRNLYGLDREAEHTTGDMLLDAGTSFLGGEAFKLGKGVMQAGGHAAARAGSRALGTRAADTLADMSLEDRIKPLVEQAAAMKDGRAELIERAKVLAPDTPQLADTDATQGLDLLRQGYRALRDTSWRGKTPWKLMMQSENPVVQQAGRETLLAAQMDQLTKGFMEFKTRDAFRAATKKLPRSQRKRVMKLLEESGHAQFGGDQALDPLLKSHKEVQEGLSREMFAVQNLVGVEELSHGARIPLQYQPDYVLSRLKPSVKKIIEGAQSPEAVEAWLVKHQGWDAGAARKAASAVFESKARPGAVFAHQRLMDKETGRSIFPEDFFEQDVMKLATEMIDRDSRVVTTNAIWGNGPLVADTITDMVSMPQGARDMLAGVHATGDMQAYQAFRSVLKERFAPGGDDIGRAMKLIRQFGSNAMLTKNWVLQLSEVSKSAAYGADGPAAMGVGAKLVDQMGGRWAARSGAITSNLDELVGEQYMRTALTFKIHPAKLARWSDEVTRRTSAYSALGTVQTVAERAAKEAEAIASGRLRAHSGAILKQAAEILPNRPSARAAAEELASAWSEAAGAAGRNAKGLVQLPERLYEEGVRELVTRWHYQTGAGMIMPAMRNPGVATALQYRAFMVQAQSHFKDDVIKPILNGVRNGDVSLAHLGMTRLIRSLGYSTGTQGAAIIFRDLISMRDERSEDELTDKVFNEVLAANGGIAAQGAGAAWKYLTDKDSRDFERLTQTFPTAQFLNSAARELGSGDVRTLEGARKMLGGVAPVAGMVLEGPVKGYVNNERERQKRVEKLLR